MKKLFSKSLLLLSVTVLCSYSLALACDCIPHSMEEDFESVDFVIQGKVTDIKDLDYSNIESTLAYRLNPEYVDSAGYYVEINVSQKFKGSVPDTIIITPSWSGCDFFFRINSEYVIFGYRNSDGHYHTNICTKTFKLDDTKLNRFKAVIEKGN
ncbi:hypothetical protein [Halalkalibaculum roseum]|nr:hypothetical protein [Halalkalibaculum roseum]